MATYTQILYQIVFSTKYREKVLLKNNRKRLFSYMWKIIENKKCHLYRIGGVEDHLHIITHLHPSIALANLVKDIKIASSLFIKDEKLFPDFSRWQIGYGAFTYSYEAKNNLIEYVKNQEQHHKKVTYIKELKTFLKEFNIPFEEKYLE